MKHHTSTLGIIFLIGLVTVGLFAAGCANLKQYSIAPSTCSDYTSVPNSPGCNTDADCITKLVPPGKTLDDGVALRCASAVCQVKVSDCSPKVGQ